MADRSEKQKVLVVDDAPENIQVLMETLKGEYAVVPAVNGQKALKIAETAPVPDIILLDIMMPEMDGYEVCRRLKANRVTRNIPVIFVTALDQEEDETMGLELGAVDYITKPISPAIVQARVKTHLNLKNAQQRLQDLLSQTLSGSVRMLVDILGLVNPMAFSRSSQIRRLTNSMVKTLGITDVWKFDLAAMLSQIGCVTLPAETLKKFYEGLELTEKEQQLYSDFPKAGAELIANIPHLEQVAGMIARQRDPFDEDEPEEPANREPVILGGQILKIATDHVQFIGSGMSQEEAIHRMGENRSEYDPKLVGVLAGVLGVSAEKQEKKTVPVKAASTGMIIDQDVYSDDGALLVVKGTELSVATIKILQQYGQLEKIKDSIRVLAPKDQADS